MNVIGIALNELYRIFNILNKDKWETANSRLVLQIHDELLVETDERETAQVQKILEEEMTGAAHLAVRLEIDMHTGKNWYEAK